MLREAPGRSGKQTAVRTAPIVCPEESPLVCSQAQAPCPRWGLIRRLPEGGAGGRAESHPAFLPEYLYPVGFFANYGPKVSKGERREAGIQWIQPPKAVSDPEFRQTTSGAHGSAGRADCLPRGKPFGAPAGAYPCPRWGMTRRLRRGVGLAVPRGAHPFLSMARRGAGGNVGKRVPSGHNRRGRLATRSSGKQQAERTAVRAAPIVCPEESPLVRPQAHTPAPGGD